MYIHEAIPVYSELIVLIVKESSNSFEYITAFPDIYSIEMEWNEFDIGYSWNYTISVVYWVFSHCIAQMEPIFVSSPNAWFID